VWRPDIRAIINAKDEYSAVLVDLNTMDAVLAQVGRGGFADAFLARKGVRTTRLKETDYEDS
jgi:hypothetical protein